MPLSPIAGRFDGFLLDLDGCLWVGDEAVEGSVEALAALREAGKRVLFLTNDPRHSVEEHVRKLWRLGFRAAAEEVLTVGAAIQHLLAERGPRSAFVVGSKALVEHVAVAGLRIVNRTDFASRADVVVVSAHDVFEYEELRTAVQAVIGGAELIGATRDATFPMPDGPWPGSGSVLAAVEAAAGREADVVVGKPERPMYDAALERLGVERVLAVGDRPEIDVAGATAAGLKAALVLSGGAKRSDVAESVPVAATLGDLLLSGR